MIGPAVMEEEIACYKWAAVQSICWNAGDQRRMRRPW